MSSIDSQKVFGQRVERFLRARHPQKTCANVAADTGLSEAQISKWLEGKSAPGGAALLALIAAYGPQFLADVMPKRFAWLDKAAQAQRQADLEAHIASKLAELETLKSSA